MAAAIPDPHAGLAAPSPWVVRWAAHVPAASRVLDVACGGGRHTRWFAGHGHPVDAVDRNAEAIAALAAVPGVQALQADIEGGPWPCAGQTYGGVIVTHYLHRPLFPALLAAVAPGGVLIYETFALGNERYGRPSNPDFLLAPGELRAVVAGQLEVLGFEEGYVAAPKPAVMQRICARRPA